MTKLLIRIYIVFALFLCGCSAKDPTTLTLLQKPKSTGMDVIGEIDLLKEDWLSVAYDTVKNDYRKWMVASVGTETKNYMGETVSESVRVLKSFVPELTTEEIPDGLSPVSLRIGNSDWKDYSFSFDFLAKDTGGLSFAVYQESSKTGWDYKKTGELYYIPFYFSIGKYGLSLGTGDFPVGWDINNEDDKNVLGKYDSSVWNNVKLTLDGLDLHLIFNGEDKGVIWTYQSEPFGSVGFGAADGVMIKDIKIVHE